MDYSYPRTVVSGLCGSCGKTLLSIGLAGLWRRKGINVAPFKKGPDFIDASWLSCAAGVSCRNLDTFMMGKEGALLSFLKNAGGDRVALVEGNRGLYDGMDVHGTHSTAALARLIDAPVILVVDCTKATRTIAAMISGCQKFEPSVNIRGIVLNRVANKRHEDILVKSIRHYCDLPVLGAIPTVAELQFPERHLGLIPPQEHPAVNNAIARCAETVEKYVDFEQILETASGAPPLKHECIAERGERGERGAISETARTLRIGVVRDAAFHFYYPENLEALEELGASIVEISAISDLRLPDIDALIIGGGFPETCAEALSANVSFHESLRRAVEDGLPVYAECGGAVFLGKSLIYKGKTFPMAGIFPVVFGISEKPAGHGYTRLEVVGPNPYFSLGHKIRGHEFHYSYILKWFDENIPCAFHVVRGSGFGRSKDGLCCGNVLATYTHIHATGEKSWAESMVALAAAYSESRASASTAGRGNENILRRAESVV